MIAKTFIAASIVALGLSACKQEPATPAAPVTPPAAAPSSTAPSSTMPATPAPSSSGTMGGSTAPATSGGTTPR